MSEIECENVKNLNEYLTYLNVNVFTNTIWLNSVSSLYEVNRKEKNDFHSKG